MTVFVCLMYHEVLPGRPQRGQAEFFAVSKATLARHLEILRDGGYHGGSLASVIAGPDAPRVAITFDDGTAGHYECAFRELLARDMTATFFVTTSWVGRPGFVTWDQLKEMEAAGMEIGSHTCTHPFLSELTAGEVSRELLVSRETLKHRLSKGSFPLALPGGDAPRRDLDHLFRECGYYVVATSRWGTNPDRVVDGVRFIRRCTVRESVTDSEFQRIVVGERLMALRQLVRQGILSTIRRGLGASRYARIRGGILGGAGGGDQVGRAPDRE